MAGGKLNKKTRWQILQRDNFQCQICGYRGTPVPWIPGKGYRPLLENGYLEIHHVNQQDMITLCVDCHHEKRVAKGEMFFASGSGI